MMFTRSINTSTIFTEGLIMSWDIGIELNGFEFKNTDWNYTHNCNQMMRGAGYDWIYNLDKVKVKDTIPHFEKMLENLKAEPEKYRSMNPSNNWGDYDSLVALFETEIIPTAKKISDAIPEATWWESS